MACETNCNSTPDFDCVTELKQLFTAYLALSRGQQEYIIESGDQYRQSKVQYNKSDLPRIASIYNQLYKTCGSELPATYPSILEIDPTTKATTKRGRPAFFRAF